ncbi:hypothetical protein HC928_17535, partial [bacterium]|nr:hypothetical protein [bacterium]
PDGMQYIGGTAGGYATIWDATNSQPIHNMLDVVNHGDEFAAMDWGINNIIATGTKEGISAYGMACPYKLSLQ